MKNNIIFLSIILFSNLATAQENFYYIKGKIIDAETKNPMQAASVFAQNTTIGTASDANGNFTLRLPNGGYDLAITFTGYETTSLRISKADATEKDFTIALKQKEKAMEDVVITSSNEVKDGWEKYGDFFLDNFIGRSAGSKQCTIINKEVLKFYYYKRKDKLKVLAEEPILLENPSLGYKIRYTLDSFIHNYKSQTNIYTGYPLFEEIIASDSSQLLAWENNRQKVYEGSILHFMRSVYDQSLRDEGFEIQFVNKNLDKEKAVRLSDYYASLNYVLDDSTQMVEVTPNKPDVAIIYTGAEPDPDYFRKNQEKPKKFQLSIINIPAGEPIGIEQNGYYFDQSDITITGYWTWHKLGVMLPYDYIPK